MTQYKHIVQAVRLTFLLGFLISVPFRLHSTDQPEADHRPGEVIVRLQPGTSHEALMQEAGIQLLLPGDTISRTISPLRPEIVLLRMGDVAPQQEQAVLSNLRNHPRVMAASLNYRRLPTRKPGDPLYPRQWNLRNRGDNAPLIPGIAGADINAEAIWEMETGKPGTVVAVLDTGIDYRHPDLAPNIWRNPMETPGNGIDDDGNGYTDDVLGFDFAADANGGNDPDPMDTDGHGTHVAGIIAARGNNAQGIAGISWHTRLLAVKTVRPDGYNYSDDVLEALEYVLQLKRSGAADIVAVNCSFGGGGYSAVEELTYREIAREGIVIAAAAGNGGEDDVGDDNDEEPFYPASYDVNGIVAVAATNADDQLTDFSNFGALSVDLAAPGEGVFSTVPLGSGRLSQVETAIGVIPALGLEYSGATTGITAALIPCGLGLTPADFPGEVNGGIALLERGETTFRQKVRLAAAAGARAAIIVNNLSGNFNGTLQEPGAGIPAVSVSRENGEILQTLLFGQVNVINRAADYDYMGGTSMATPHAAGAVALLASLHGPEPVYRRVVRLMLANTPLTQLNGRLSSGGRLNLGGMALPPPLEVTAQRRRNDSLLQTEYVVLIKWRPDPAAERLGVSGYRVFQSRPEFRLLDLVGVGTTELLVRRVSREADMEFGVAATDAEGRSGTAAFAPLRND